MEVPPLPLDIAPFVQIFPITAPNYSKMFKETKESLVRLNELFQSYMKRCETPLGAMMELSEHTTNHQLIFAYKKLTKYVVKHKNLFREINAQIGAKISILSIFFQGLINNELAASFNFDGFKEYRKDVFKKNNLFQKYYKRIQSLQSYIRHTVELENEKILSLDQLVPIVPDITPLFDPVYLYSPPNPSFDTKIEMYLEAFRQTDEYKQIVLDIIGEGVQQNATGRRFRGKKKPNAASFNKFFVSFLAQLQQKMSVALCDEQKYILRSSFLRVVFDDAYVQKQQISEVNPNYARNAFIITQLCPNDLSMPDIFTKEERNTSFIDFLPKIDKFKTIIEIFSGIQFYVNSIDIAFEVCKVSKLIDDFTNERSPSEELIKLSFDDFFIIFIVCMSLSEITNAEGIKNVEDFYHDFENSQMLKHSMTSLSAGVRYINEFLNENTSPEIASKIGRISSMLK